jgi:uncharacterized transporter YbjL
MVLHVAKEAKQKVGTDVVSLRLNSFPQLNKKEIFMKHNQPNAPLSKKVGDKIERVGQKISNSGAEKLGNAISRAGNKLEHSSDTKQEFQSEERIKKNNK